MSIESIQKYVKYVYNSSDFYEDIQDENDIFRLDYDDSLYIVNFSADWIYYNFVNREIPSQGWKIHITTEFSESYSVLKAVSTVLFRQKIDFKHIISKKRLFSTYAKNASRISAGKFIVIYPQNYEEFLLLLDILYDVVKDFKDGPYILSDRQWKNSNIFYRYGGFKYLLNRFNELCIYDNNYNLIPDQRLPYFQIPIFVDFPEALSKNYIDNEISDNLKVNKLDNYDVQKSLRFSNAGGIYLAIEKTSGRKVILKEARENIGIDSCYKTAQERLYNEYKYLSRLAEIKNVVNCFDYFTVWKSSFLVEKYIDGVTLNTYLSRNYPFSRLSKNIEDFKKNIVIILTKLKKTLYEIHKQGVFIGDFQTNNIMIDQSLNITLIDFETAGEIGKDGLPGIDTIGFSHEALKVPIEKDWYALFKICMNCFLPIGSVLELDGSLLGVHLKWIKERFGISTYDFIVDFQKECLCQISNLKMEKLFEIKRNREPIIVSNLIYELRKTIISNLDYETERLIKGDIRQYEHNCGLLNYLTGGFGVVLALYHTGGLTQEIDFWIQTQIKEIYLKKYNFGLLTGLTGIAGILYICGYQYDAIRLFDKVCENINFKKNNISLRSGLAGVGLAFAKLFCKEHNQKYLRFCKRIACIIKNKIIENEKLFYTDWDSIPYGLLDGNSGVALFYMSMYEITMEKEYLDFSELLIRKDIKHTKVLEQDGSLQIYDDRGRYLPYLSNGSIGLYIAIKYFYNISGKHFFDEELSRIELLLNTACTFNSGLYDGYAGLLILCNSNNINDILKNLQIYSVKKDGLLYFPGDFSYKLSLDVYTGIAGILIGINSVYNGDILTILPIV